MYELWQTEWCPASRRVRQRLTELGIDYFTRQVPVDKNERNLLRERTGTETIPVLVAPGEEPLVGATTTIAFADAVERVRAELKEEGFGVLCEIGVQATLREKLAADEEPYTILGACNPPLAHQALAAEPELGTLLPCNVAVYQRDGLTHISAIDADRMLSIVGNDDLAPIAAQVRAKLAAVVERAASSD